MVPNLQLKMLLVIGLTLLFLGIPPSHAAPITVPSGLNPGDPYRLVFVTRGQTQATCDNMYYYNRFVTTEAASVDALWDLKTEWTAIASTAVVDAVSNTETPWPDVSSSAPVYNLAGELVALNLHEMFVTSLLAPIATFPRGGSVQGEDDIVWTGTGRNGNIVGPLGDRWICTYGRAGEIWEWAQAGCIEPENAARLYAMSGVLQTPQPVPAPTSIVLLSSGIFGLLGLRRKGRKV